MSTLVVVVVMVVHAGEVVVDVIQCVYAHAQY
jgi:hypothetical protein